LSAFSDFSLRRARPCRPTERIQTLGHLTGELADAGSIHPLFLMRAAAGAAVLLALALFGPAGASGGTSDGGTWTGWGDPAAQGKIIDSIIIDNRNINDYSGSGLNGFLSSTANRLHYVTRASVIRRELLFAVGEPYSLEAAKETARNLRTRLAFNDARIETRPTRPGHIAVRVVTRDQWSLLGSFRIEREGNETDYEMGLEERNFLGYNQFLAFDYFFQENDEDYLRVRFANTRFWGKPLQISAVYDDDPRNEIRSVSIGRPFYDLRQHFSLMFGVADNGGRSDVYRDTLRIAEWQRQVDVASTQMYYRWGGYHQKAELGLDYDYVYQTTSDRVLLAPAYASDVVFPDDSVYHRIQLSAGLMDRDFIVVNRINGFYYPEDITVEQSVRLSYARAFAPGFSGYLYDGFTLDGLFVRRFGSSIVRLGYIRSFWFKGDRNIRQTSSFVAAAYNTHFPFVTGVFRGLYRSDWRDDPAAGVVLGGKSGLRGFDTYFSTGDRLLLFNFAGRFYPGVEILSVLIGGVVFLDLGRTWDVGEPFRFRDFHRSAGLGLRVSMERYTKTELIRIDFAYGQDNRWQLAFGTGQYF